MKYGFIIDNRKCIGCHACTTACKSEHEVPVGVNRTWVKQVEKGDFPDVRRYFSVMRCNHCTDAPCVSICPTEALYIREDGIVDFDNDRCIGCKSCMQACPYDALYIDPDTNTAAKCNYCAHRIDVGLEPACVNVCPEEAIVSGDMEDPNSKISKLLSSQATKSRKPEKGTDPNLFYIDADDVSLVPTATELATDTLWGAQERGVGHFAKAAEKLANTNPEVVQELAKAPGPRAVEVLMSKGKRVYDAPQKGTLWGWEVSAYILTKAISAGVFLLFFIAWLINPEILSGKLFWSTWGTAMAFLLATGALLVKDLDRPDRFLYVLLRPHWNSWLVKGGYSITVYGGLLALLALAYAQGWEGLFNVVMYLSSLTAILVAVYTAFLFAQAKGRDFWQSPFLSIHMLLHALMAGSAVFMLFEVLGIEIGEMSSLLKTVFGVSLIGNLIGMLLELYNPHPTQDAKYTADMILKGKYKNLFWIGTLAIGNLLPLLLLGATDFSPMIALPISLSVLIGIYITEHIWVNAPQQISLS